MTPDEYQKVKHILAQIILAPIETQSQLLEKLCEGNSGIKAEVKKLMTMQESDLADSFEKPAIFNHVAKRQSVTENPEAPKRIKQYEVIKEIGSGGMGVVYLAKQQFPAERQVAIKVLNKVPNQYRLFEETQILARLNHPNIASLHEVDKTDDGNLFIVMELIEGNDILSWCNKSHFSLNQKIKLFQQLCSGISYAHEKGIIHCDIKPSNVYVTTVDNEPLVKIIDFGISQYEHQQNKFSTVAGTPAYLAPEVLNNSNKGIADTRRDVFALGILLGEIFPKSQPKDITAIIAKATNKDVAMRYANAASMNIDLQRFLDKRMVKARPRSVTYVTSRYVQRNLVLVSFSVVLLLSLLGGFIAQSIQANKAKIQAVIATEQSRVAEAAQLEAEEMSEFLVDLFNLSNPERANTSAVSVDDLINKANDKLLAIESPKLSEARFMHTIGSIFTRMDKLEKAKTIVEKSLEIKRTLLTENHDDIIGGITQLGLIHRRLKNNEQAESLLLKAIALHESKETPNLSQLAYTHNHLGNLFWQKNDKENSVKHHNQSIALRKQTGEKAQLADSYNNLGAIYKRSKQWDLSKHNLDEALMLYRETYDEGHPYIAFAENNLANVEEKRFNWKKAEYLYLNTYKKLKTLYGESHQNTLISQVNLAVFYTRRLKLKESIDLRIHAIEIYKSKKEFDQVVIQLNRLAQNYFLLGDFATADLNHNQALMELEKNKVKDTFLIAKININYADLLIKNGDIETAKKKIIPASELLQKHPNDVYFYKLLALNQLAKIHLIEGEISASINLYTKVIQLSDKSSKANQREVIKARIGLGNASLENNQSAQAEAHFKSAEALARSIYGENHQLIAKILFELSKLHLKLNNPDQAGKRLAQTLQMQELVLPAHHPELIETKKIISQL